MRQYTEEELRARMEAGLRPNQIKRHRRGELKGQYKDGTIEAYWVGIQDCARFLGALSEAHKGETDK